MEAKNLATPHDLPTVEWSRVDTRLREGLSQAPGTGGPNRHTSRLRFVRLNGWTRDLASTIVLAWTGSNSGKSRRL
jgi:hypothetical protein